METNSERAAIALENFATTPRPAPTPGGWTRQAWLDAILAAAASAADEPAIGWLAEMLAEAPWEAEAMVAALRADDELPLIEWMRASGRVKRYRRLQLPPEPQRSLLARPAGGGGQRTIDGALGQGKKKRDDKQR
jgi:hypothetical protein